MSQALAKQPLKAECVDILAAVRDIPTLPAVAARINELINDPNSSSADIAAVLKKDQVLTAKILRLVNSSYYAIPGGVSDVQRALAFLGFNTLAQLVLGISVFSVFGEIDAEEFSLAEFWKHALGTAVCSELIAKRIKHPKPDEAFTCGLLHDIGKLVLHEIDPRQFAKVVGETRRRRCSFIEVEEELEIPGHAALGEAVAEKWGLPQAIRQAIRHHHAVASSLGELPASVKPLIAIVRLGNAIVVKRKLGNSGDWSESPIPSDMLAPLGLSTADIQGIESSLAAGMERAGALLVAYR